MQRTFRVLYLHKSYTMIGKVGSYPQCQEITKAWFAVLCSFNLGLLVMCQKQIQTRMLLDEYIAFALFYQYFYLLAQEFLPQGPWNLFDETGVQKKILKICIISTDLTQ